ncbi:MAG: hypothetical protein ABIP55_08655 [Tepidisphaeraceae bacterium]
MRLRLSPIWRPLLGRGDAMVKVTHSCKRDASQQTYCARIRY